MVGKKKFGYGTKGKAAAKAYAKKTGKKMVKRKKKWVSLIAMSDFQDITNLSELLESLKSLPYLPRRVTRYALLDSEILICEYENPNPHGVNPSEQDISAMKRSLN